MNTMSSTKFHHLLYNINILGEELYKYLCFRSNPINYLYLSMYMYVVLNYEINMFKLIELLFTIKNRTEILYNKPLNGQLRKLAHVINREF